MIAAALALSLCQLAYVRDGDTFVCTNGEVVREATVDTPELNGRCEYERQLAIRARDRLEELLGEGFVLVRSGRATDRYRRQLRVVVRQRDNRSVGDILVSEGLARTWSGRRRPWC